LLKRTDRMFSLVVSDSWLAGLLRTRVMPKIMGLALRTAAVQRIVFRTISQTGIRYRTSPLSEALADLPEDGPRAGDRFPWLRLSCKSRCRRLGYAVGGDRLRRVWRGYRCVPRLSVTW